MKWTARWTRDRILFATGLVGVAYETLVAKVDRPALLVLFGAMLGLPAFLKRDESSDTSPKEDEPNEFDPRSPKGR